MRVAWWPSCQRIISSKDLLGKKDFVCSRSDLRTCTNDYEKNLLTLHHHRSGAKSFPFSEARVNVNQIFIVGYYKGNIVRLWSSRQRNEY